MTKTHLVWRVRTQDVDHLVSPLLVKDQLLFAKAGGFATGFALKDGRKMGRRQRIGLSGALLSQPILADGKIYVCAKDGKVAVLAPGAELKVLARNDLGEDCIATPAVADGRLYLRTRTRLYCVGTSK